MFHRCSTFIKIVLVMSFWFAVNLQADEGAVDGTWKTEASDTGGYLYVDIAPCEDSVCGTISKAFNKDGEEIADYAHIGKVMLSGMKQKKDGSYAKGKIWAPDKDKTYKSKMKIEDGSLSVSGCVAFICRSQVWIRVN